MKTLHILDTYKLSRNKHQSQMLLLRNFNKTNRI